MYLCLPYIINPMYIQNLREMVPPPSQNTVGVCNQITYLILYYISSSLVALLTSHWCPYINLWFFYLIVSFKLINFSFQYSSVTWFRLSTLLWFGCCKHCILACFLWFKKSKHSSSNHGLCCFMSYRPRPYLAEVLIFSFMFSQAPFM